jgi:hypothetical protein
MTAFEHTSGHSRTHPAQPHECHSGHTDPSTLTLP